MRDKLQEMFNEVQNQDFNELSEIDLSFEQGFMAGLLYAIGLADKEENN